MSTYNKQFEYKNYKFNIKVEMNVEPQPGKAILGRHRITVNDMGPSNFYHSQLVMDKELEHEMVEFERMAKNHVDRREINDPEEIRMNKLGFNK